MTVILSGKRVMFEIYREPADGPYKVVYFTELGEHERELEIGNAMRGEHVFDGFLLTSEQFQAKRAVNEILDRLNNGEQLREAEIESRLKPFMP
jgi:hypothetical protein